MLRILVATMTGTAEMVAEALRDRIAAAGSKAEIVLMDGLDPSVFVPGQRYLICSSTYGQGDVPDNAQALFARLEAERPDLSGVEFGLVALGDMTYAQTFCYGGKRFGGLLSDLGATLLGEPMFHDASAGTLPEDVAVDWLDDWLAVHDVCGKTRRRRNRATADA
jgi:MioC protein